MIFVKNKTDNTHAKLGKSLGVSLGPLNNENNKEKFIFKKLYNNEINKFRKPLFKKNNNLIRSGEKAISQKTKHRCILTDGELKNSCLNSMRTKRNIPYDPYLINACKQAIFHVKKQLPNYRDVINKINSEFGIEDASNLYTEYNGNKTCRSFSKNNNFVLTRYSNTNNNTNSILPKFYRTFNNDLKVKSNDIENHNTEENSVSPKRYE